MKRRKETSTIDFFFLVVAGDKRVPSIPLLCLRQFLTQKLMYTQRRYAWNPVVTGSIELA